MGARHSFSAVAGLIVALLPLGVAAQGTRDGWTIRPVIVRDDTLPRSGGRRFRSLGDVAELQWRATRGSRVLLRMEEGVYFADQTRIVPVVTMLDTIPDSAAPFANLKGLGFRIMRIDRGPQNVFVDSTDRVVFPFKHRDEIRFYRVQEHERAITAVVRLPKEMSVDGLSFPTTVMENVNGWDEWFAHEGPAGLSVVAPWRLNKGKLGKTKDWQSLLSINGTESRFILKRGDTLTLTLGAPKDVALESLVVESVGETAGGYPGATWSCRDASHWDGSSTVIVTYHSEIDPGRTNRRVSRGRLLRITMPSRMSDRPRMSALVSVGQQISGIAGSALRQFGECSSAGVDSRSRGHNPWHWLPLSNGDVLLFGAYSVPGDSLDRSEFLVANDSGLNVLGFARMRDALPGGGHVARFAVAEGLEWRRWLEVRDALREITSLVAIDSSPTGAREGLFSFRREGATKWVVQGDAAPVRTGGVFDKFGQFTRSDDGTELLFVGQVKGGSAKVGLFSATPNGISSIVQEGDTIRDTRSPAARALVLKSIKTIDLSVGRFLVQAETSHGDAIFIASKSP